MANKQSASSVQITAADLAALREELAALRTQVANAAPTSPARRGLGQRRRAVGLYWNHPQGSMQFQNDLLDANARGFLTPDPKGTETFEFTHPETGKATKVRCRRVHLTDRELCSVFNAEYDQEFTKPVALNMVRVIRDAHNLGRHGKYDIAPTSPVPAFDAAGREIPGSAPAVAVAR